MKKLFLILLILTVLTNYNYAEHYAVIITGDTPDLDAPGEKTWSCLLYTSPSPRDRQKSRMPSSA